MGEENEVVPGMATAVEARARALGLTPGQFVERSGLTDAGLAPVRQGVRKRYAAKTRYGVARALRWPVDWYDLILAGEDPATFPDVDDHPAPVASIEDRLSVLEARVEHLADLIERDEPG